jgi:hypothetical protein
MERIAAYIMRENETFEQIDNFKRTEAVRELFKNPDVLRQNQAKYEEY